MLVEGEDEVVAVSVLLDGDVEVAEDSVELLLDAAFSAAACFAAALFAAAAFFAEAVFAAEVADVVGAATAVVVVVVVVFLVDSAGSCPEASWT